MEQSSIGFEAYRFINKHSWPSKDDARAHDINALFLCVSCTGACFQCPPFLCLAAGSFEVTLHLLNHGIAGLSSSALNCNKNRKMINNAFEYVYFLISVCVPLQNVIRKYVVLNRLLTQIYSRTWHGFSQLGNL